MANAAIMPEALTGQTEVHSDGVDMNPRTIKKSVQELRELCPLPALLQKLKLGRHAKGSSRSPLRDDRKPSWSIYKSEDRWFWKDHGNGDYGDEITLLARLTNLDGKKDFSKILDLWEKALNNRVKVDLTQIDFVERDRNLKPDKAGFGPGTDEQIARLAALRGFDHDVLQSVMAKGLLVFGNWWDHECYGLTDRSGKVLEFRRLDGELFPEYEHLTERKSHAKKNSHKNWPVGIEEAQKYPFIVLVEGVPDFLAAHQICKVEGVQDKVAPVAILAASIRRIDPDALAMFKGKHVRIVPHQDDAGIEAADRWKEQLIAAGAKEVDFFNLGDVLSPEPIKDLCDYKDLHAQHFSNDPETWRVLP